MEQPTIPERLARIEVQLMHLPTRSEMHEKFDELRRELRAEMLAHVSEIHRRLDLFQAEVNRRFEAQQAEMHRLAGEQRKAIAQLYVFIIGTALASLTLGLGGVTILLSVMPLR